MSSLIQFFRESFRNEFAATMFFLVTGTIAFFFIGYLMIDFIRTAALHRQKRKHRHSHAHHHPRKPTSR